MRVNVLTVFSKEMPSAFLLEQPIGTSNPMNKF